MIGLAYSRLLKILNSVPPYRGTTDRFPIGNRKQNNKSFIVREEDGAKAFDIVYGYQYEMVKITREAYEAKVAGRTANVHRSNDVIPVYSEYVRKHNVVGTVRADNTFTFTKGSYYQGERMFLDNYHQKGYFSHDSRRGGMIFNGSEMFYPVWRYMSIDCETGKPTAPYQVTTRVVDRKKSRDFVGKDERFFKISEVMLKSLDHQNLVNTTIDVVDGIFGEDASKSYRTSDEYLKHAHELQATAPLDAFILFTLAYDVGRLEYLMRVHNSAYTSHYQTDMDKLFINTKRRITHEFYKANPDVFKIVEHEMNEKYPASDWGTFVTVDGQPVEQY